MYNHLVCISYFEKSGKDTFETKGSVVVARNVEHEWNAIFTRDELLGKMNGSNKVSIKTEQSEMVNTAKESIYNSVSNYFVEVLQKLM